MYKLLDVNGNSLWKSTSSDKITTNRLLLAFNSFSYRHRFLSHVRKGYYNYDLRKDSSKFPFKCGVKYWKITACDERN